MTALSEGRARRPCFIGSEIYRTSSYGARHPLSIPRVSTVIDLCRALGWLPDEVYIDSPRATPEQLARFHSPDYIAALVDAEQTQSVAPDQRRKYNIGCNGNPVFPEIFSRPATASGGSILGAGLVADRAVVYNPAGGTHHGRRDRASGFCYLNDPVLAILTLLDHGVERVLYLDVDAHHCDGVQAALSDDPRVLILSVHEAGRWPMNRANRSGHPTEVEAEVGSPGDRGAGQARNFAVPPGFNDTELEYILEAALLPLAQTFAPQAVVLQCGADALEEDPLSKLSLSNRALWRVVAAFRGLSERLLVLGGGGYNPWSVARCWTGVWACLNHYEIPERLPAAAENVLLQLTWRNSRARTAPNHWFNSLADQPRLGPIREEVRAVVRQGVGRAEA